MDRRELLYFVTVVEQGALSRAAQRLEISQPTLSHCMAVLEERHGTKLLLRSSVGVRPTAAGPVLYRHARTILAQMLALDAELAGDGEQLTGEVAVGLPSTVAEVVGADFVTAVQLKHPRVRLTLFESFSGYIEELLVNGRLDLAVLFRRAELPGVTSRSLFTERLHVFGLGSSSALCSLRELDSVPLILPASGSGVRYLVERAFADAKLNLNVVGNVDSLRAMMKLVAARRGVTMGQQQSGAQSIHTSGDGGSSSPLLSSCSVSAIRRAWRALPSQLKSSRSCAKRSRVSGERGTLSELGHERHRLCQILQAGSARAARRCTIAVPFGFHRPLLAQR